ncbi:hypothetical protein OH492_16270 [Vibrio chagasii]|nr:hypothetical protein [Vibrio chagasii]
MVIISAIVSVFIPACVWQKAIFPMLSVLNSRSWNRPGQYSAKILGLRVIRMATMAKVVSLNGG